MNPPILTLGFHAQVPDSAAEIQRCGYRGGSGHNRRTCPTLQADRSRLEEQLSSMDEPPMVRHHPSMCWRWEFPGPDGAATLTFSPTAICTEFPVMT